MWTLSTSWRIKLGADARLAALALALLAAQACASEKVTQSTHELADGAVPDRASDASNARAANGSPCDRSAHGSDCESGHCVDEVCCQTSFCGLCEHCVSSGKCEPVRDAADHDSCAGARSCNARGECMSAIGATCTSSEQCGGETCSWGTCCAQSCGTCRACTSLGDCEPVHGGGHVSCNGGRACSSNGECEELELDLAPGPDTIRFGAIVGSERVAQIFYARRAGRLDEIQMRYICGGQLFAELHGVTTNARGIDEPSDGILSPLSQVGLTTEPSPRTMFVIDGGLPVDIGQNLAIVFSTKNACDVHVSPESILKLRREQERGTWTVDDSGSLALRILIH